MMRIKDRLFPLVAIGFAVAAVVRLFLGASFGLLSGVFV